MVKIQLDMNEDIDKGLRLYAAKKGLSKRSAAIEAIKEAVDNRIKELEKKPLAQPIDKKKEELTLPTLIVGAKGNEAIWLARWRTMIPGPVRSTYEYEGEKLFGKDRIKELLKNERID